VAIAHLTPRRAMRRRRRAPALVSIEVAIWLAAAGLQPAHAVTSHLPRPPDTIPHAGWIVAENRRPGTTDWRIPHSAHGGIEGYADRVSAVRGDHVELYVSTRAARFHVEAYRIGYYAGLGGRLVWRSRPVEGTRGRDPVLLRRTNTIVARWPASMRFRVTRAWVQGDYLLKLVSADGDQSYIPLTIRNDSSTAALVVQNAVTTWQAYNRWGGYSLYDGPRGSFADRSRMVSFDRPYEGHRGAAAFPWMEQPLVTLVERYGMDVTYQTDVDLHKHPGRLLHHRALVTLGHDEYWSSAMRDGALAARTAGVNIAFLGGNTAYRHVRFEPSALGRDRHLVCYKIAREDPLFGVKDKQVTSNWRDPPVPRPESVLLGGFYRCGGVYASLVVSDPGAWIFDGTNLPAGARLPGVVRYEVDNVDPRVPTPDTIEILAHSPVSCFGSPDFADMTYYTTTSGAGVFNAGDQGWMDSLRCLGPVRAPSCNGLVSRITRNVLAGLASGPAALLHRSRPNLTRFGIRLRKPIHP
jgi:hypothetical protein